MYDHNTIHFKAFFVFLLCDKKYAGIIYYVMFSTCMITHNVDFCKHDLRLMPLNIFFFIQRYFIAGDKNEYICINPFLFICEKLKQSVESPLVMFNNFYFINNVS